MMSHGMTKEIALPRVPRIEMNGFQTSQRS
ncbi:hypothetical protein SIAM614_17284 [Stappia aggregata IAM 12614]|uniref:Uncharacterized protein n=1 Tax=Roseibium aggregatum (strain ATCC 25650 / DSM 13394 / JCM 20685 / NBRC 16684 / NCIMB 2208 / IAM 12614 / B1) TaxID=384765 RepID=A0P2C3_ROSAI|nr:hypothetical protein SIAM614_17284 [Stappia aggregata IAM 12614] [Roseibium aggregatum IAM 12614]